MISTFEHHVDKHLTDRLLLAVEAGEAAGGEMKQIKSAALLVVHSVTFPIIDLRVDISTQPLADLRFLWELYQPGVDSFVCRAIDPDGATGYP
jgi:uncharacterized Ntn-hydrolase superfamily protein